VNYLADNRLLTVISDERSELEAIRHRLETLSKKYGLTDVEALFAARYAASYVPVEIFSQQMAPLEAVVSYLKDNMKYRFSRIAQLLSRDDRTIWTTYRNARGRAHLRLPSKSKTLVPISILKKKKLSIQEALIIFLRENKGMTLVEIAVLLNKSTSTVWTSFHRAKVKLR
jgi:hypothetical protein